MVKEVDQWSKGQPVVKEVDQWSKRLTSGQRGSPVVKEVFNLRPVVKEDSWSTSGKRGLFDQWSTGGKRGLFDQWSTSGKSGLQFTNMRKEVSLSPKTAIEQIKLIGGRAGCSPKPTKVIERIHLLSELKFIEPAAARNPFDHMESAKSELALLDIAGDKEANE